MKALLLAAGYGTRLKPLTNYIPKCLVPINGKPLLEYWLDNLYQEGIKEFLINTHYLSEQVEKYIENSKYKKMVTLVYEKELLFTGGTILKNKDFFGNEEFMVVHADNLCFCNFKEFMHEHKLRPKQCIMTMMIFLTDNPKSCGIVDLDENNVVTRFYEKVQNPPSNLANGAVYIFSNEMLLFLGSFEKDKIDLSTEIIPNLLNKIMTYENNIYLKDIGTLENYSLAQVEILEFI
ncbi:MAG: nucleotidyltransferase family protein [Campylobacterota bacterium]|nr:nucleotidyltransferase family protein [Campylobacterota bacterium]